MKVIWRFVLGIVCSALLGSGSDLPTKTPSALPHEVAKLLPHAVVLREVAALDAPDQHLGFVLLGLADLTGDAIPDLVVGGDRAVQVLLGDGQGQFSPGPWIYLQVEEYSEGQKIPGRHLGKDKETRWVPYELAETGAKSGSASGARAR